MFEKLGHLVVRRRKSMVIFFIIGILAAGGVGSLAFSKLDSGGYSDLGSESAKAYDYLTEKFKVQEPEDNVFQNVEVMQHTLTLQFP